MAARESFDLEQLVAEQKASGRPYLEFLRVPALSCGVYVLPAGGTDPQLPHRFHAIEDDLMLRVLSAPAEGSSARRMRKAPERISKSRAGRG